MTQALSTHAARWQPRVPLARCEVLARAGMEWTPASWCENIDAGVLVEGRYLKNPTKIFGFGPHVLFLNDRVRVTVQRDRPTPNALPFLRVEDGTPARWDDGRERRCTELRLMRFDDLAFTPKEQLHHAAGDSLVFHADGRFDRVHLALADAPHDPLLTCLVRHPAVQRVFAATASPDHQPWLTYAALGIERSWRTWFGDAWIAELSDLALAALEHNCVALEILRGRNRGQQAILTAVDPLTARLLPWENTSCAEHCYPLCSTAVDSTARFDFGPRVHLESVPGLPMYFGPTTFAPAAQIVRAALQAVPLRFGDGADLPSRDEFLFAMKDIVYPRHAT